MVAHPSHDVRILTLTCGSTALAALR